MSGRSASQNVTRYPGIQVQTSSAGLTIPMGWGTFRCKTNLIWYGDFKAKAVKAASSGGKGGGSTTTGYTYSASFVLGICEGPIDAITTVYVDSAIYTNGPSVADPSGSGTALSQAALSVNSGAIGQAVWSYLTTNFPNQALGYSGLAIAYAAAYPLDSSASTPNFSFEVERLTGFGVINTPDASPAAIIGDFFENPITGVPSWVVGLLDPVSLVSAANSFENYTLAAGLLLSPVIDAERSASDFLTELLLACNSTVTFSEGLLKFIPYGDVALSGNGATYTPNLTPVYSLTDDQFQPQSAGVDPLMVDVQDQSDAYNVIQLEFLDRTNSYNLQVVTANDAANVEQFGERRQDPTTAHCICTPAVAAQAAQLYLQRTLYIRAQYKFSLDWRFGLLEPGDLLELTDVGLGLNAYPVRIIEIDESENSADDKPEYDLICEDLLAGVSNAPLYNIQNGLGFGPGTSMDPGGVEANLLLWSDDASNAAWIKGGCTVVPHVANDQYGLPTASIIVPSTATGGISAPVQLGATNSVAGGSIGTPVQLGVNSSLAGAPLSLSVTTLALSPAGNAIVVFVISGGTSSTDAFTITDGAGNTYVAGTPIATPGGGPTSYIQPFYCLNAQALSASSAITANFTDPGVQHWISAVSVSGIAASGALDTQAAGTSSASGTTPSIATGTLAQAAEIVFGFVGIGGDDAFTEAPGFSPNLVNVSATNGTLRSAYQIVAATTSVTYAPVLGVARLYMANVISFKAAPSSSSTLVLHTTADSPAGNAIAVFAGTGANLTITSVTDSAGNTYTGGTSVQNVSNDSTVRPFWVFNAAHLPAGGTITVTYSGSSSDQQVSAISVGGVLTSSALDTQGAGVKGTGTAPSSSTGTLASSSEIVLGFTHVHVGASDTFTEVAGFTSNTLAGSGAGSGLHSAYKIVSATTSVTYNPTLGTSRDYTSNVLSFKGASPTATSHGIRQGVATFGGANYIGSLCAQQNVHKDILITLTDVAGVNGAFFGMDTSTGAITSPATPQGSGVVVNSDIQPTLVSGIWQMSLCVQVPGATELVLATYSLDDSGNFSWVGDNSHAVNISQMQIRQGTVIGEYAATTNAPLGPFIFNPTSALAPGVEAWAAVAGGPNWGGAYVWVSIDGTNYVKVGTTNGSAAYGLLTTNLPSHADPDTTNSFGVDLGQSDGELISASQATADNGGTTCLIDGEVVGFEVATLTNPGRYTLGTYTRRGFYNTPIGAHFVGAPFARLDDAIFSFPYIAANAGQVIWVKFQSFSLYGFTVTPLANCVAYPFTPIPIGAAAPASGAWTAVTAEITSSGFPVPAIIITGALDNQNAELVAFYYRVHGGVTWTEIGAYPPATTTVVVTAVGPNSAYDVGAANIVNGIVGALTVIASNIVTPNDGFGALAGKTQVNTGDIVNNAVNNPTSGFVGTAATLTTTATLYSTATLTTVGGQVLVMATASFSGVGDVLDNHAQLSITRDGTVILGPESAVYNGIAAVVDLPSAGAHTYGLSMKYVAGSGGAPQFEGFYVQALEVRDAP